MSFTFLAPLALALGALLALPILAHLSLQVPKEKRAFGAMMLLERMQKRLRRRRRLKDPLLLLLRLLALAAVMLAIAGARLTWPGAVPEYGGSGRVVLIVDQSMSMSLLDGGATLLQRARGEARTLLSTLPPGTQLGLVAFGGDVARLTPELTSDSSVVAAKIDEIEPTLGTSDLRSAVHEARKLLAGEPGEIFVFTDESGPRMVIEAQDEIAALVASGSALLPRTVRAEPARNVAVVDARYGEGIEGGQVTLRIGNYGPSPIEVSCEVLLPSGEKVPIFAELPASGESEERITVPRDARGGVATAKCDDPDLPADDSRAFHLPEVGATRVLVVDGDPGATPTRSEVYFLERALSPWGSARNAVTPDVVPPIGLTNLDPAFHRVVFIANVADLAPWASSLREFVRQGGSVVLGMGSNVVPERYNDVFGPLLPSPLRKARSLTDAGEPGVAIAVPIPGIDLLAPFDRAGRGGFARIRAHRVMTLDPYEDGGDVRTLLRFEGGAPALVERRTGLGSVLVWTSTFDHDWGNFPLQAVYMPLMQRISSFLGGASQDALRVDALIGETVTVPLSDATLAPRVFGSQGEVTSHIEGTNLVFRPPRTGAYAVRLDETSPLAWVAVNVPGEESDVRHYGTLAEAEARIRPDLFLQIVDLGAPLLAFALVTLLLSAVYAVRGTS